MYLYIWFNTKCASIRVWISCFDTIYTIHLSLYTISRFEPFSRHTLYYTISRADNDFPVPVLTAIGNIWKVPAK